MCVCVCREGIGREGGGGAARAKREADKVLTGGVSKAVTGTRPAVHLLSAPVDSLEHGDTQSHTTTRGAVVRHAPLSALARYHT